MSDILQEVDEALKQDKIIKLWQNYGRYLIAALVLVIVMTAAKSAYEYQHRTSSERATTALLSILNNDGVDKQAALSEYIKTSKGGSVIVAQLELAGAQLKQGDSESAFSTFNALADNGKAPAYFQDFAKLMSIQIKMDTMSDEQIVAINADLETIINDEKSLWRYHAMLNRAAIKASQADYKAAIADAGRVKTAPNMPQTLINRAIALEQLYTIKLSESDS
jgi:hypothetical protein|tara:strand:+ start:165759 stop:166424 length:666 start_codon:yes stop_codon:yes gene_type:complete